MRLIASVYCMFAVSFLSVVTMFTLHGRGVSPGLSLIAGVGITVGLCIAWGYLTRRWYEYEIFGGPY